MGLFAELLTIRLLTKGPIPAAQGRSSCVYYEAVGTSSLSSDFSQSVAHVLSSRQQREASGVQGAAMSLLVAARCGEIFNTEVGRVCCRTVATESCRLGLHSTMRAAALLPGTPTVSDQESGQRPGPMTPAQISQYAAPPIRYGQPQGTVACPLG